MERYDLTALVAAVAWDDIGQPSTACYRVAHLRSADSEIICTTTSKLINDFYRAANGRCSRVGEFLTDELDFSQTIASVGLCAHQAELLALSDATRQGLINFVVVITLMNLFVDCENVSDRLIVEVIRRLKLELPSIVALSAREASNVES